MRKNKTSIKININLESIDGILALPEVFRGVVVFAHGAGSSRFSPRNTYVAEVLQGANIGTLLFDLLTEEEDLIFESRFDIELLTQRLLLVTNWLQNNPQTKKQTIGYFGASTGSAAALKAAASLGSLVKAVVSRGGRPDLAKEDLSKVKSPTLLIVGGDDDLVLKLNKEAYQELKTEKKLEIISGATHLFEEPGALEKVAQLAKDWFKKYL
jgi:dienelactone hydrolase